MDTLERFIRENREKLDRYEPDKAVWNRIRVKSVRSSAPLFKWIAAAAIIILVLGTSIVLFRSVQRQALSSDTSSLNKELKETELFYRSLTSTLFNEARPYLINEPEIESELLNDMARIDSICAEIRKDLKDNVSNREVVEALIQNYRIKLLILEDILDMLRKNENQDQTEKPSGHEL